MNTGHILGIDLTNWNEPRIILYDHVLNIRHTVALFDIDELLLLDFINYKINHFQERKIFLTCVILL